jgi:hypothetical protein
MSQDPTATDLNEYKVVSENGAYAPPAREVRAVLAVSLARAIRSQLRFAGGRSTNGK